ncbi:MAG: hypothetical protein ACFCD0_13030 [Gemmataceae bacterium]
MSSNLNTGPSPFDRLAFLAREAYELTIVLVRAALPECAESGLQDVADGGLGMD